MLAEHGAVLFELDLALDQLLILASPISLAGGFVLELYELYLLGHVSKMMSHHYSV